MHNILCTYHHGRDMPGITIYRSMTIPGYTKTEAGPSPFKYIADVFLLYTTIKTIRKTKPNIIYAHLHEGLFIGWIARFFFIRKIPLIFDMQGSLVGELEAHGYFKKHSWFKKLFVSFESIIVKMPDHIMCSSKQSVNLLKSQFKVAKTKITLVNDGADITSIHTEQTKLLKAQLKLPSTKPIVVYSGALLAAKGLDALCNIINNTEQQNLECHFLIIGYPTEKLETYLTQQKLNHRCTITGRIPYEKLANYLALAHIAIEPKAASSAEASGKLLNYMGAGLPVVCFDTENNRQLLRDNGFFVPPMHIDMFTNQLNYIFNHNEEATKRGHAGKARVKQDLSWNTATDKVANVLHNLLIK